MDSPTPEHFMLSPTEIAVVQVLLDNQDKVVGRESLARLAGLEADSMRRVDSCLVAIRKALGADSIVTVRRRGWMLSALGRRAGESYLMTHKDTNK